MMNKAQYAVIFTSQRSFQDQAGYEVMVQKMLSMVQNSEGFISADSLRDSNGFGITISYWSSFDSIKKWKFVTEHLKAQELGKSTWYSSFTTRICRIEEENNFP